ncbi:ArsJ-associated glyceraldehyde-3-phosphate dehydrogenase [Caulobacter sp. FWC2]|uniref:ArsJ-associated glyceraldehyde-3-phosphate dehydrogenase n=1 Tax=Caulobacter sp. FWC2 TaxID=69664 RepID=UPI000C161419|nr:ArsJ-associated glyceraldehyde-3-phosphate dehydrogenase [Caulobacter sp. FWC2]PIB92765.1 type I glyceraldehyde-3-phosphate dehydrogenase [Caulobacter sp. FWC2]
MKTRVGINGFGRMGRLALRLGWDNPDLEFTHINEPKGGARVSAHLTKFDSVHGRWPHQVEAAENAIVINGKSVTFTESSTVEGIGWRDVDVVLECSGKFRTPATLQPHLAGGVRKVIVSAPVKEDVLNIVMGINDHLYDPDAHDIVTAASCTTNCLAPIVKVIHENLGIRHGVVTTIHDMTNTQAVHDTPLSDLRRARAASLSLIPTTTGSATAIALIYPELQGRLNGLAVRVPLLNASLTDAVFEVEKPTTVTEVNALFKTAAQGSLQGILGYEELPLVSVDFKGDTRSTIIDADSTMVVAGTQVKVLGWYDNEIGYVSRMIDLTRKVGHALSLDRLAAE